MTQPLDPDKLDRQLKSVNAASTLELRALATHIRQQLSLMKSAHAAEGGPLLTDEEHALAEEAHDTLATLVDAFDERATRERIADAPTAKMADHLDSIYDLTGDVMHELEEVESTITRTDWPRPHPYTVADQTGHDAQEFANALRELGTTTATEEATDD